MKNSQQDGSGWHLHGPGTASSAVLGAAWVFNLVEVGKIVSRFRHSARAAGAIYRGKSSFAVSAPYPIHYQQVIPLPPIRPAACVDQGSSNDASGKVLVTTSSNNMHMDHGNYKTNKNLDSLIPNLWSNSAVVQYL